MNKNILVTISAQLESGLSGEELDQEIKKYGVSFDSDLEIIKKLYEILEEYREEINQ